MATQPSTSKHLRSSTELTLVAPIQQRFVLTASNDVVSMATRLEALLRVFFELRRAAVERALDATASPLERMRTLHAFSWAVLREGQELLLTATFDRPWEPYIRTIVDHGGPLLDAIFCHCEGYEESSTDHGFVPFASWVRAHQREVSLFYAAEPDLTVDDRRTLRELERAHRESAGRPGFEQRAAAFSLAEPGRGAAPPRGADPRLVRAAAALVSLRDMFHASPGDAPAERARRFFDGASWLMLEPLAGVDIAGVDAVERLPARLLESVREMRQASAAARPPAADGPVPDAAERERLGREVQGNILAPYAGMTHGVAVLLGFDGPAPAREFAALLAREVTVHADASAPGLKVNVAWSPGGLLTLGLSEAELASFPHEFRVGMAARAGLLGDVGPEHPDRWSGPLRGGLDADPSAAPRVGEVACLGEIDALLLLQAPGPLPEVEWGPEHPLYRRVRELVPGRGARVVGVLPLQRELATEGPARGAAKERFGFVDGLSQPVPPPWAPDVPERDRVALGELLLGHPGDRGPSERYPTGPERYTRDGSFLVVRQLEQDVEAFEAFIDEHAGAFAGGREALYAKLMGRRRDGGCLGSAGAGNDFDYAEDPHGDRCPLMSHARRCNPRAKPERSVHGLPLRGPRIARRGFSYGPFTGAAGEPRGLLFMAFNASIAEQFEVIQRWINGANGTGLLSAHADPIVSHRSGEVLTLLDGREPRYLWKKKPFVTLRWGAYFFAPSRSGLSALADLDRSAAARARADAELAAAAGAAVLERLRRLEACEPGAASFQWRRLLQDRLSSETRRSARALWTAIRVRHGGVLRAPCGVLVGTAALVRRVLSDESCFSVSEYGRRMRRSVGPLHLGLDRCSAHGESSAYRDAAAHSNAFMVGLTREGALALARASARRHFERLGPSVELAELARDVVSDASREWFGLPRDRRGYDLHHTAALAIFSPDPADAVTSAAARLAEGLPAAVAEALAEDPPLARYLRGCAGFSGDVAGALVGGAQGTLAATVGSFLGVIAELHERRRLGRLRAWLASDDGRALRSETPARAGDDTPLVREVLAAMCARPTPELLHRTVVAPTVLGDVEVAPGDRVVLGMGSALADDLSPAEQLALLFGGDYPSGGDAQPKHPCPGREAALGLVLGLVLTLLENDVRHDQALCVSRR